MKSSTLSKMKSSLCSDEIEANASMKWNPPTRRRGEFHPPTEDFIDEVDFTHPQGGFRCSAAIAAEQKARVTYDNILRLSDDPDVNDVIKFLRQREVVHYQRFGDMLRRTQEQLDQKNYYAFNPSYMPGKKAKR